VVQGDADTDLTDYPDAAFDIVILSNSIQALRRPDIAINNALRVGREVIVTFPNFGHWRVRTHLAIKGTMPRSRALPDTWFETDNIHLCTIKDFVAFAADQGFGVKAAYGLSSGGTPKAFSPAKDELPNFLSEAALFLLSRP
ncbi:MAG: methionine biosynthesis protein MetW, partial [Pseudomonadota bacterium]